MMKDMFPSLLLVAFCMSLLIPICNGQKDSIFFALNGRSPNSIIINEGYSHATNPFARFVGDWTLKNDKWIQNWGDRTDTIEIKEHHTVTRILNTENSILSIIDGPEPNGHIFWAYNPVTNTVHHSSSFGEFRIGQGQGQIDASGNVFLKIAFEGEAKGTYRRYDYIWVNDDEYHMKSVQFDENDEPTGLYYEGRFIRVDADMTDENKVKQEILKNGDIIRAAFREGNVELIESLHHPDVLKALSYGNVQNGREEVMNGIKGVLKGYTLEFVENDVESLFVEGNTVIEQSKFSIRGVPRNGGDPFIYNGRTMVTYVRYKESPTGWATIREIIQPAE